MLALAAVGDLCTEAVEAAEAVVQVIFNKIDALFLQLNQKVMIDCHLITVFCTLNCYGPFHCSLSQNPVRNPVSKNHHFIVTWAPKNKSCPNELKFCEDSRNPKSIRC